MQKKKYLTLIVIMVYHACFKFSASLFYKYKRIKRYKTLNW